MKVRDAHDLLMVMDISIEQKSEQLDFQDIIKMRKTISAMASTELLNIFSEEYKILVERKTQLVQDANKKATELRKSLLEEVKGKKSVPEDYERKINKVVADSQQEAQESINEELNPEFDKLYNTDGNEEEKYEVSNDQLDVLIATIEKFGKEYYSSKKKMVDIYMTLTASK